MKILKNGLITGLLLQLAIGPVFFFIINLTLQKTILDGLAAVIGVTMADYCYIILAVFGIGKLLERRYIKRIFGILSSIVLIGFGIFIITTLMGGNISNTVDASSTNLLSSFTTTFLLTISSPLTIVLFTGLFAAKAIEYRYTKKELFIFGLGTGLATLLFMGTSVILFSFLKEAIPIIVIQILNFIVGCLLISYGGIRLIKTMGEYTIQKE